MHWVKNAEYKKDYQILLEFEDGKTKIVDLKKYLNKGIFVELKNLKNFKKFKLNHDTDTIEWYNGADMSPDFLYEIGSLVTHASFAAIS